MSCQDRFIRELRQRGFRLTAQREMVLSALHQMGELATAEEIYRRVQAMSAAVDISTVYRTLDLFQQFRLVSSIEGSDGQRRYELHGLERHLHIHLVCSACGNVITAGIEPAQAMAARLLEAYGFELDLSHLSLPGLCHNCAAAEAEPNSSRFHPPL